MLCMVKISRRRFIKGAVGLGLGALTGCSPRDRENPFIPANTLDDYLAQYAPQVENIAKKEYPNSGVDALIADMFNEAAQLAPMYSKNENYFRVKPAKYNSAMLASASVPGDVDSNGVVNIFDLIKWLQDYSRSNPNPALDVDGNGKVDIFDLLAMLRILSGDDPNRVYLKGNIKDIFSNVIIPTATVDVLDAYGNVVSSNEVTNGSYRAAIDRSDAKYRLRFSDNTNNNVFYAHTSSLINADRDKTEDITLVPGDFNMPFFDEVCVRGQTGTGTQRWVKQPKFYVNVGPAYGSGIQPTQEQINVVLNIIKNELPRFTDGFIINPVIEQGTNPPPYKTEGYIFVDWDDTQPGSGSHGETLSNNGFGPEIISSGASIRTFPATNASAYKATCLQELTQVLGARSDADSFPTIPSVLCVGEGFRDHYTTLDLQVGKLLYGRPAGTRSPDTLP